MKPQTKRNVGWNYPSLLAVSHRQRKATLKPIRRHLAMVEPCFFHTEAYTSITHEAAKLQHLSD